MLTQLVRLDLELNPHSPLGEPVFLPRGAPGLPGEERAARPSRYPGLLCGMCLAPLPLKSRAWGPASRVVPSCRAAPPGEMSEAAPAERTVFPFPWSTACVLRLKGLLRCNRRGSVRDLRDLVAEPLLLLARSLVTGSVTPLPLEPEAIGEIPLHSERPQRSQGWTQIPTSPDDTALALIPGCGN